MKFITRFKWSLVGVVFAAVSSITGSAMAWQVAEFGESGFLNVDYQVQVREAYRHLADPQTDLYFRRNRLSFLGAANEVFGAAVQFEYTGDQRINNFNTSTKESEIQLTLLDYYLTITPANAFQFRVGKTKHVMTREVQEGCYDHLSLDRSYFIGGAFSNFDLHPSSLLKAQDKNTRDIGVVWLGNLFDDVFQFRLAAMQGNNYDESTAPDNVGFRYTGRIHLSLLDPESGWGYRGSYLGKKKVLTIGAGYDFEPNAVFDRGTTGSQNYQATSFDGFYEQPTPIGTFTLSGAYMDFDFGGAGTRSVSGATGIFGERSGWYGKAGYMLGKVQIYGRYESWNFARFHKSDEDVTYTAGGVNYYIKGQDLKLTLDISRIDQFTSSGAEQGLETVIGQVQARF